MKRAVLIALITGFTIVCASAQESCESQASKAVGKDGRPLVGAAKAKVLQKCKRETCAAKALDKNGNKMKGAVKNRFMAECEKDA
jgi:hypothetical protein